MSMSVSISVSVRTYVSVIYRVSNTASLFELRMV